MDLMYSQTNPEWEGGILRNGPPSICMPLPVYRIQLIYQKHICMVPNFYRHLNGALVSDQLGNRPALMVAGATGCLWPSVKADRRDEGLLGDVMRAS